MDADLLKLFEENYTYKGMCSNLKKYRKTIRKEFRKSNVVKEIPYYPWAVVERLFRMQGGTIRVAEWATKVTFPYNDYAPDENGDLVLKAMESNALFIHLVATWQGLEVHEYYPIFDNKASKIIKAPNSLDLNKARQRGMVRLIARTSGIGLDIFEQTDDDFEDENLQSTGETTSIRVEKKTPKKVEPIPTQPPKKKHKPEDTSFLQSFLSGDEIKKPEVVEQPKEQYTKESQEYASLLLEVRKTIRDTSKQSEAKAFVTSKGKSLLSELSYFDLEELKQTIK